MTTPKTYILDTTVLIDDPDLMYKLSGAVVIPLAVIKELDGLKRSDDEYKAKAARKVARTLDRLGSYGDLREGVKLSTGGILRVYTGYDAVDGLHSEADNRIVGVAMRLQREVGNVTLLTTDGNMRTVARVNGVKAGDVLFDVGVSYEKTVRILEGVEEIWTPKFKRKMYWIFSISIILAVITTFIAWGITDEPGVGEEHSIKFFSIIFSIAFFIFFYILIGEFFNLISYNNNSDNHSNLYEEIDRHSYFNANCGMPTEQEREDRG